MNLLTYLMLTIVINYVCDCTIWGYYPLGIPAVLTAQYIILNLKGQLQRKIHPTFLLHKKL